MPGRRDWSSSVRDALLVVVVATFAFALGLLATGIEFDDTPFQVVGAMRGGSGLGSTDPVLGRGTTSRVLALYSSHQSGGAIARLRSAPVLTPSRPGAASVPEERFSGEGAGRRDHITASDPHSRRSYILDTASLMHRRGWIGLESRVAAATAGGVDNASRPAARSGPR